MLRMKWHCSGCGAEGYVEDTTDLIGACPNCMRHKGEVEYDCDMSIEEFLNELANMNETAISQNANAISECAWSLKDRL